MPREGSSRQGVEAINAAYHRGLAIGSYRGLAVGSGIAEALIVGVIVIIDHGIPDNKLNLRANLALISAGVIDALVGAIAINRGWYRSVEDNNNDMVNLPNHNETFVQSQQELIEVPAKEAQAIARPGPLPRIGNL